MRPPLADEGFVSKPTLLFVEDEECLRQPISRMLRKQGFSVVEAKNGDAAIELFRQHESTVTMVLLDLTLPGLSGSQVLLELRRIRPDIKVILTTAYNMETAMTSLGGQHPWGFVQKPYRFSDLLELLRKAL